jgi:hypothetical protein
MILVFRLFVKGQLTQFGLLLFIGINVMLAVRNALSFPKYWQDKANEPVAPNAIRVVALGDSAMQAIGAAHPEEWGIRRADFARYFDAVGKAPYSGCIRSPKKGGA